MSMPRKNRMMDGPSIASSRPDYLDLPREELARRIRKTLGDRVFGLSFSAYLPGQSPEHESQLSEQQIRARMEILAPHTRWVRTFSCTDGNQLAPPIAHQLGLKTLVGAWVGKDRARNELEIAGLIALAKAGHADQVAVGNEVLLRGDLSEDQLLALIRRVKEALPGIPVGYVDAYYLFAEHPRLVEACDVLFINCYPFWEKFNLESSPGYLHEMVERVRRVAGGKPIVISETGWPTAGAPVGDAVPSVENALVYALNTFEWTAKEGIPLFYFAGFDEEWKAGPEGDCGSSWGFWDQHGRPKHGA